MTMTNKMLSLFYVSHFSFKLLLRVTVFKNLSHLITSLELNQVLLNVYENAPNRF